MNFEVFNTPEELEARVLELEADPDCSAMTWDFNGTVFTLKWR